ncbi:hypothetical protein [Spirosoma sp.]|uniref:hypothetical protein n=1 Tax=Spirosoma sp. TaxID=1899569 RepID=UPI00260646E5|nr:hypothetical protein [Spirosoma sp.]MCX6215355.1 hypothetical protein [Spirosoma sp.]
MDDNATSLNNNNFQPFHPCLVGLSTDHRDALPVARQPAHAERTTMPTSNPIFSDWNKR